MANLWAGRFEKELDSKVNDFNASIGVDCKLAAFDIKGSMAHAAMLGTKGIISASDSEKIVESLGDIYAELESGALKIDYTAEDVHMFVEAELTKRLGDVGKRLHTARSRNDQVALDTRMYARDAVDNLTAELKSFLNVIVSVAEKNTETVMPGYTHLQRAQPITFAHHLMAYAAMFLRDVERLADCRKRINVCPIGSCALAGTTYPIDRFLEAEKLGFDRPCTNSLDGVSDRDFVVELASCLSIIMMHLSRFSEEVVLWCSFEFKYLELDDAFATGSSIMPQKKNPDIAELVRGKTGRVYGNLMGILTVMKGLPLAYNKDMQEDKEGLFDSVDTVLMCLPIFAKMLETANVVSENMRKGAQKGFINATDCADYLVKKGMPFRSAYKITGSLVAHCIAAGTVLEELSLDTLKAYSTLFDSDVYTEISMDTCLKKRTSYGGPSPEAVKVSIEEMKNALQ